MKRMAPAEKWWPEDLGEAKRLLVERNGELTTYDSGEHRISGLSQQGSDEKSLAFSSEAGPVRLDYLRKVDRCVPPAPLISQKV